MDKEFLEREEHLKNLNLELDRKNEEIMKRLNNFQNPKNRIIENLKFSENENFDKNSKISKNEDFDKIEFSEDSENSVDIKKNLFEEISEIKETEKFRLKKKLNV